MYNSYRVMQMHALVFSGHIFFSILQVSVESPIEIEECAGIKRI